MRRGPAAIIGLALASAGCASGTDPTPSSPTPIPSEPCQAEMAESALAGLAELEGYRFHSILENERLRRPTNLNNPVFEVVSDRTTGAFLAPGRLREEVIGSVPGRSFFGYDARIMIDGRSWLFHRREGRWEEVPALFEPNPANAINVIIGGQPWPFEVTDGVVWLQGDGGCVLTSQRGDARSSAAVSLRLDPVLGRVVAWQFEQDAGPEPGDAIRQSVLIEHQAPLASEFQPPPTFEPMP
jgi:hypothetical protein